MNLDENLHETYVGTYYNGVRLDKALVERICVSHGRPMSLKNSMDSNLIEWMFWVGIYESNVSIICCWKPIPIVGRLIL